MSNVYIVQDDPNKNFISATKHGELQALLPFRQIAFDTNRYVHILRDKLKDFNPAEDHILLIGDPVAIALVSIVVADYTDSFSVLKWDREQSQYYPITINLK